MAKVWKTKVRVRQDLIEQLLTNRGIKEEAEREKFFNPNLNDYSKDLQISGTDKALRRIEKAIESQETIVVYGDYDVDGVCASAILYKGLSAVGAKVLPYIPHREKEGYGLSKTGLEFARDSGASVVITVDNGIVALEQARFAKEIGLDLIITDHHVPLDEKPEAFAIVHSVKMCGAAVAWCLIKDFVKKDLAKELLQFVAIATICDLLPLKEVNRAFVFEGIKVLQRTDNLGLRFLISECGIDKEEVGSYEIGHVIGPRINAVGRLEHAIDALRLICTKDPIKAKRLSKLLCETNTERQKMTAEAVDQARLLVEEGKKIHVLHSKVWSQGIIGLVAGRITEETYTPTIAISVGQDGRAKGSARSVNGVNIVEVIRQTAHLLIDVGGHSGAAGFSIQTSKIEDFKMALEKVMDGHKVEQEKVLEIEAEVESKEMTKKLAEEIEKFAPFGFGNPQVILATKGMRVSDLRTVGAEGKHLKLKVDDIDAIAFGFGDLKNELQSGQLIDVAYNLEINRFNGREILQLKVKDIVV